jgi:Uncharacterized protein conserved in bacteria
VTQERSIIAEIEGTFANGSAGKQAEILRRVTDLFLAGADKYSDEHVDLFDGVISRIAEKIETKARAELAHRLAPAENAPPNTVRMLARDESIEVAGPILSLSNRLSDDDLLAIASDNSQDRLLAISKRPTVSEKISDVLVTHGNRDVVLSVTQNEGARFSDAAYGKLVDRSINDEVLAICVSMRKDIPQEHFNALIAKASEVVFEKLRPAIPTLCTKCIRYWPTSPGRTHRHSPGKSATIVKQLRNSTWSGVRGPRLIPSSASTLPRDNSRRRSRRSRLSVRRQAS